MVWEQILAKIGDSEKHIQLRALVHQPKDEVGPQREHIRLTVGQDEQDQRARGGRELMIKLVSTA